MSKNIIFCADGTWNGPGDDGDGLIGRTNVYKLYANLDGAPAAGETLAEQERSVTNGGGKQIQIAKYLHGVGNSDNALVRLLGGAVGTGLIARIVRGYTFISRNYLAGDRIYIAGFSRGAYTARALAGLISARGLLDATSIDLTDRERAYRLGLAIWWGYRRQVNAHGGILGTLRGVIDGVAEGLLDFATSKLITHVPIEAIAVWDTVGELGIPIYDHGATLDVFRFTNNRLPAAVRTGIHAVAIDEERETFTPTLWDDDPRVTQVLFSGAHSDIGGGYPEDGLSDIAYVWMADRLVALGVLTATMPSYVPDPKPRDMAHCPWASAPWPDLGVARRTFPANIRVKASVCEREAAPNVPVQGLAPTKYAPGNADCFSSGFPLDATLIEP